MKPYHTPKSERDAIRGALLETETAELVEVAGAHLGSTLYCPPGTCDSPSCRCNLEAAEAGAVAYREAVEGR